MIVNIPSSAGEPSYILYEKSYRKYDAEGVGSLSIKSFFNGQALYEAGRRRYLVRDDSYLLLNSGQSYAIHIDAYEPMDSFCVFFADGMAQETYHSLAVSNELDGAPPLRSPLGFFEKTYRHDALLTPALLELRAGIDGGHATADWLEERMQILMERLLHLHFNVYRDIERLPAMRPATREELYRRLHEARDYAAALFHTTVTLADLASIACLSPNHLLRTFKQLFGQTPHQFIVARRLEEAQRLLRRERHSVTEVCFAVGFESLGTFSALFRRRFGVSPTEFRRAKR